MNDVPTAGARDPGDFSDFTRARRSRKVPSVLTQAECKRLFETMEGTGRLMAELMCAAGLRLSELLRLRVKDVDLERLLAIEQAKNSVLLEKVSGEGVWNAAHHARYLVARVGMVERSTF